MTPIQQMLLGVGAVAKKTYVDDLFSTYVFKGNGSTGQTINNGINLSGEGGLVWNKDRENAYDHVLWDTVRGDDYVLASNSSDSQAGQTNSITYNSNGYTLNGGNGNENNQKTTSWTFRKAPGFFDVVTYTGTGSARTVDHNLGCIPGMIIIKRLDTADNWNVYHRNQHGSNAAGYYLQLNTTDSIGGASNRWNDTAPTATEFTVGTAPVVNANGDDFVAYVFAGGESTNTLARSVKLDGSGDYLQSGSSSDFTMGTGDFTIEGWFWKTNEDDNQGLFQITTDSDGLSDHNSNSIALAAKSNGLNTYAAGSNQIEGGTPFKFGGQWAHVAMVRSSGVTKVYGNGTERMSFTDTYNYNGTYLAIGGYAHTGLLLNGKVSNFRVVKGTAVYTSSFKPPTEPLTSISGTVLLCCNNSSVTGTTTGSISSNGDPTASTDSPFDDPAGFAFGDAEDQNVIKCGSYTGNGSSTGPTINLGWEPQLLIIKNANATTNWRIVDSMRGIVTGGDEAFLTPDLTEAEWDSNKIDLTSTGFKITASNGDVNESEDRIIYIAIRRPDGYVGKPPELGTGVFAMDTGNSSATVPCFDSTFPVDFLLQREFASADSWITGSRHTGNTYMYTNATDAEAGGGGQGWDSNVGGGTSRGSSYQAWMFKRHAGFDVVTYKGNAVAGRPIPHSLSKTPEMIWLKSRTSADQWVVGHKGLNGGTNPWHYWLKLQSNDAESNSINNWNDQAPTSTHFIIDDDNRVNKDGDNFIAMLFASVDGISKVGYYSGNGSSGQTITTGFQPRFLIIKNRSASNNWFVLDTTRGWGSGNDNYLMIDQNDAQDSHDFGAPTSTGFTLVDGNSGYNQSGNHYIYYAHA